MERWLAYIERLHHRPIDLTLERVRRVADRLGIGFDCPAIVVAGTNGKGSTCALLDAILRAAGYRVGLYTSPHLLRFNERASVDGMAATDAALIAQFEAVEAARNAVSLTYFEFTTLAVLRLFQQARLDAVVLEVGLGGRLDAVNLIDADCAVLTSIGIDHVDYLGPTREHIGFEKAHICRRGRPLICAEPDPPRSVLDVAAAVGADLWRLRHDFDCAGDGRQWRYRGRHGRRHGLPYPSLRGDRQLFNASAALAALESLSRALPVSQQAVREGLVQVRLPGRFQVLPGRPTFVLDVAHNPQAAAVLAANLDNMGCYPATHAVFGMLRDKDCVGMVAALGDRIDHWHVATTEGARGMSGDQLADRVRSARPDGRTRGALRVHSSIDSALDAVVAAAGPDDRILVFGSFVTVGAALRWRDGRTG